MGSAKRILIFGDSLGYGAWDSEGGWAERLKREAHRRTIDTGGEAKIQVINLSIGGDTSAKILARMENEIKARLSVSWPLQLVFSFGVNDERMLDGVAEVGLDELRANVAKIIEVARKYTEDIVFLDMPPLPFDAVVFKDKEYSDTRTKEYEAEIQKIVDEAELKWVAIRPAFVAAGLDGLYAYDNLHPNDRGHELIYDTVKGELL